MVLHPRRVTVSWWWVTTTRRADMARACHFPPFADRHIPCPLQMRVHSITLDIRLLPESAGGFVACPEPAVWSLVPSHSVRLAFNESVLASDGMARWTRTWELFNFNASETDPHSAASMAHGIDGGWAVTVPDVEVLRPTAGDEDRGLQTSSFKEC